MAGKTTNVYISDGLREKFSGFRNAGITVVHAPAGYGKTRATRDYLKGTGYNVRWINCDTKKDIFWTEFCDAVMTASDSDMTEIIETEFPDDAGTSLKILRILGNMQFKRKTVLVLDNYNMVTCSTLDHIFFTLREKEELSMKIILITGGRLTAAVQRLITRRWINYVNEEDFSFKPKDIKEYFAVNGQDIDMQRAEEIYGLSGGWPMLVHFFLRSHMKEKGFDLNAEINEFLNNEVFFSMPDDEKLFMVKMSVFDSFTVIQAAAWNKCTQEQVKTLIENNVFIRYNSVDRVYYMNPFMRRYLEKDFREIPEYERTGMFMSFGDMHNEAGVFLEALKCYYRAGSFQKMFEARVDQKSLFQAIIKENKPMFLKAAESYFGLENKGDYQFAISLIIIMFLYNENQLSAELREQIVNDLSSDDRIEEKEKDVLFADISYADYFLHFNDYGLIEKDIRRMESVKTRKYGHICGNIPFAYGSPSILLLFHSTPGKLEKEIAFMEKASNTYYQFTGGHGKGYEIAAKAEMYYLRGDVETAEILCLKSMYISESRNQYSVFLAANFILARISVFTGDNLSLIGRLEFFYKKIADIDDASGMYSRLADQCRGFIYASIGQSDRIPDWLKDQKKIEDNSNFITLASANIIYGRYLIMNKQYHQLQAVSGHFIGIAEANSYVIPKIYTYIYISISNNETGLAQKAQKLLREAVELACDDMICMPFVENFTQISQLMESAASNERYANFVKEVKRIFRTYSKGLKVISKSYEQKSNFGLTAREADVARLAAQRMSNKEIAGILFIAESTVKSTMKAVFSKLGINSRSELKQFFE